MKQTLRLHGNYHQGRDDGVTQNRLCRLYSESWKYVGDTADKC